MWHDIILAFIPIFVSVDALGTFPIFLTLTEDLDQAQRKSLLIQSIITAMSLAVGFVVLGKLILRYLSISMGDFMIAGGAVLLCFSITDLLQGEKHQRMNKQDLGPVPIGTPLIVGPAVLTTCMMMRDQYGLLTTLIALFFNIVLAGMIFARTDFLLKVLGRPGSRVLSKVMGILLAAIAVMMMRKGVLAIIAAVHPTM